MASTHLLGNSFIGAKGWKRIGTPQNQSGCCEFVKFGSSPGPEAVMSFAWLPGLGAEPEGSRTVPAFGTEPQQVAGHHGI